MALTKYFCITQIKMTSENVFDIFFFNYKIGKYVK